MSANFAIATVEWGTTPDSITLLQLTKDLMGITDNSRDDELSMYLQMAGEACEKYIDNKLAQQEVKEDVASAHSPFSLRFWPSSAPTAISIDGEDVLADFTAYISDGIMWISKSTSSSESTCGFKQMTVTYTAGYEPLPAEIGYAISRTAIAYEAQQGASSGAVKKEVVQGVGSIEYATDADSVGSVGLLSPATVGVLDMYRRWHV